MLKKRKQAFVTIRPLFRAAELSTGQAAADAATCIAEMLRARIDANLPIDTGTHMLDKLVDALNANVRSDDGRHEGYEHGDGASPQAPSPVAARMGTGTGRAAARCRADGDGPSPAKGHPPPSW